MVKIRWWEYCEVWCERLEIQESVYQFERKMGIEGRLGEKDIHRISSKQISKLLNSLTSSVKKQDRMLEEAIPVSVTMVLSNR